MTATPADRARYEQAVQNAANIAVVEMLRRPEYSMEFIEECIEDFQKDTNIHIDPDLVAEKMDAALADLAKPFLDALPADIRERYQRPGN